jgi:hypothetical protein
MATVALSTLRSKLQTFLKDTSAKKWTADDLDIFINLAIVEWTTELPIASACDVSVVSGEHAYDLPDNAVSVTWVRGYFESTASLETIGPMRMGEGVWTENDEPRRFIVQHPTETQIYLPREPQGDTFTLYYGAVHQELLDDADALDLRLHRWGEQAVIAYAAHLAFLPYSASRARLEQWSRKTDLKVDNPLSDEAVMWLEKYDGLMAKHAKPDTWTMVRLE